MEPCAVVSASWASSFQGAYPTVPAQVAYDCLKSVPLYKDAAIELVDAIQPYIQWQSNLAFLKSPPADYEPGPFDIVSHLETVRANLEADKYNGELAFQEDLFVATAQARDGHFYFLPDALTSVFEYERPFGLVSYAEDTTSLPVIKKLEEVREKGDEARTLTRLNEVDASQFINNIIGKVSSEHDLDSAYNAMFFSKAKISGDTPSGHFKKGGWQQYLYPGENTTAEFATGEKESAPNIAIVKASFAGVTDGKSFYKKFCTGDPTSLSAAASQASATENDQLEAALTPVVNTSDGTVQGFYIDVDGLKDVAVLLIPSFQPDSPMEFQQAVENFLKACRSDGKSRIIIDLQMNGGGHIFQGLDAFRQFFPNTEQRGFNRWRENDQFMAMAEIVSKMSASDSEILHPASAGLTQSTWNYHHDLDVSGEHFRSFEAKFAPNIWAGDPYTAIMRWDPNTELARDYLTEIDIDITGYGNRRNFTQPFKAENIILLTDGYCASTCSLFASEMKRVGVKSVVVGGRPEKKPMQAVGGTKGVQTLTFDNVQVLASLASNFPNASAKQKALLSRLTGLPVRRSTATSLNVRDQILAKNLDDGVPAQFVNEPADCRLFWTLPMILNVSEVWKAAADAAWSGAGCASGGFAKGTITSKQEIMKATTAGHCMNPSSSQMRTLSRNNMCRR